MLGTRTKTMAPNDLIKAILKMDVDLLWNGGIGTYVKSSGESHSDVGDRANDGLRINGGELGAKIVGEGGNLGLTQLGRMEFAMNGGRVNTDFTDNVGGVDCSDNEVNIKILLNSLVANGDLTMKKRNELLVKMEDEVSEIVLDDAYCQSESISVTQSQQVSLLKEQIRFIHYLEKEGKLDRALEYLPDDDTLYERQRAGYGLTRPELAVLVAYGKMYSKSNWLWTPWQMIRSLARCFRPISLRSYNVTIVRKWKIIRLELKSSQPVWRTRCRMRWVSISPPACMMKPGRVSLKLQPPMR